MVGLSGFFARPGEIPFANPKVELLLFRRGAGLLCLSERRRHKQED